MTPQLILPSEGAIEVDFPKWDYFASTPSLSFLSSIVECKAATADKAFGTKVDEVKCEVTNESTFDTLKIQMINEIAAKPVFPVILSVNEVRGPPSTSPVTGFKVRTKDKDGQLIDQTNTENTISIKANSPQTITNPKLRAIFDEDSSRLTFQISVSNPLRVDSTLIFVIGGDYFGFTESMNVKTSSDNMHGGETLTATFYKSSGTLKL